MYKYIGTEQQLLDLGFEKCKYHMLIRDFRNDTYLEVWGNVPYLSKNDGGQVSIKLTKLFVEMVELGLIVWEE